MKPCLTRITALFACCTALVLPLLSGCGATSTAASRGAGAGGASSTSVAISRGPQLGYYWSPSAANLYPILGVAGAAHFGPALLNTTYALGVVGGGTTHAWALLLDASGTLTQVKLPAMTSSVIATRVPQDAAIVLSPSGIVAAIVSQSAGSVTVLSALATTAQSVQLAPPTGASLAGIAVSDAGTVLAGWRKPGASGVQVGTLTAQGASAIATITGWGGAAFAASSAAAGNEQAVVADAATTQLFLLAGIGTASPTSASLATGGLLQSPVAVGLSIDGKTAFVADSAKQQLVKVDLSATTAPSAIACACQPAYLVPLPGTAVFALAADSPGQPAWLLDTRPTATRTFFVPALATTATAQSAASTLLTRQAAQ